MGARQIGLIRRTRSALLPTQCWLILACAESKGRKADYRGRVIWLLSHPSALFEDVGESPSYQTLGLEVLLDDSAPLDFDELMLAGALGAPSHMIEDLLHDDMHSQLSPDSETDQEDVYTDILAQAMAPGCVPECNDRVEVGAQSDDSLEVPYGAHGSAELR
eukprot:8512246-Pyramimonas_sp.AAC.1